MAVRSTMTDLIARVRQLIGDASAPYAFTDQQVQDALDHYQRYVAVWPVESVEARNSLGQRAPVDFEADYGFWEADALLQGNSWQTISTTSSPISIVSSDYLVGRWTLNQPYLYFLYITGKHYDVYGAAADLLEETLALHSFDYDFLSAGRTFKRSQSVDNLHKLINRYRARMLPTSTEMIRTDLRVDEPYG